MEHVTTLLKDGTVIFCHYYENTAEINWGKVRNLREIIILLRRQSNKVEILLGINVVPVKAMVIS